MQNYFRSSMTRAHTPQVSSFPRSLSIVGGKTKTPGSIDIMITVLVVCFDWIVLAVFVM